MADLQAQRTLVKSAPELWAELSNPESLGRRLAEFGEIRITRLVGERTVAWEGERASGTVELESSGWGTKVRLTATPADPVPLEEIGVAEAVVAPETGANRADATPVAENSGVAEAAIERVASPAGDPLTTERREEASTAATTDGAGGAPDPPPTEPGPAERSAARVARRAAAAADGTLERSQVAAEATAAVPSPPVRTPAPPAPQDGPPAAPARRGFFARLFGRRRGARGAEPTPAAPPLRPGPGPGPTQSPPTPRGAAAPGLAPPAAAAPSPPGHPPSGPVAPGPTAPAPAGPVAQPPSPPAAAAPRPQPPAAASAPRPTTGATSDRRESARYAPPMPGSTVTRPAAAAPVAPIARTPSEPAATPVTAGPTPPRTRPAAPKALDVERTMAVLSSVLDDLGAAHHRPFSRE